jgi:hypothetical protein
MVEPHLVGALRKKRAEIVGRIISLEKELRQGRADLRHLDATLRLFAPNLALSSSRNGLFRRAAAKLDLEKIWPRERANRLGN